MKDHSNSQGFKAGPNFKHSHKIHTDRFGKPIELGDQVVLTPPNNRYGDLFIGKVMAILTHKVHKQDEIRIEYSWGTTLTKRRVPEYSVKSELLIWDPK